MIYYFANGRNFMFNRVELKTNAKVCLQGNWSYMAGLMIIILIISGIGTFFINLIPILGPILIYGITIPLNFSQIFMSAKLYKQEQVLINDVFLGFNYYLKCIGLTLWMTLWITLWTLLLIVPGMIKTYSYSFAMVCLQDNPELSIREALKESIRLTNGYKAELFVLSLSWFGWSLLAVLTCGIGYLFLSPYMNLTHYSAFRAIKAQKNGEQEYQ